MEAVDPPLLEGVDDHLRVRVVGPERVPAERLQLGPDLRVVVDLAVEDEVDRAVLVRHRLHRRVGEVDDREPAEAEADAAVVVDPGVAAVGAAVDDLLAHRRDVRLGDPEAVPVETERADDAAHQAAA